MYKENVSAWIGVASTLLGAMLGTISTWLLTRPQVKLAFSIQPQSDFNDAISYNMKTKTSDSGYCVYCYNNGDKPFILDSMSLCYKHSPITELGISTIAIKPYGQYVYIINRQEYDNILFHCMEKNLEECDVYAYDVSGEKYKTKVNLLLTKIQTDAEKDFTTEH